MFEAKDEITEAANKLWDAASQLVRGDVFSWDAICESTGMHKEMPQLKTAFIRFRKRLLNEKDIAVWPVNGVGFKLLAPTEQVRVCSEKRQRKMFRQAQKAIKEVGAIEPSLLPMHDRRLQFAQLNKLKEERRQLRRSIKEVVCKKTETLPVRKFC